MKRLLIIPIVCMVLSCELVVEVDVPGEPSKLVVSSILTPDSTFVLHISASAHILSRSIPSTEAAVPILTDGNGRQIALMQGVISNPSNPGSWHVNAGGWMYTSSERPVPGTTYTLKVTAPNFGPVVAVTQMPTLIDITSARIDSAHAVPEENEGYASFPVEVIFKDSAGVRDYYYPQMSVVEEYKYYDHATGDTIRGQYGYIVHMRKTPVHADIPDFSEEEEDVISDAAFDGSEYTLRRYVSLRAYPSQDQKVVSMQFILGHAGYEYNRYFRSKQLHRDTRGNPLAEPVQVYSNVDGGLGIFAGYTHSSWEFIR